MCDKKRGVGRAYGVIYEVIVVLGQTTMAHPCAGLLVSANEELRVEREGGGRRDKRAICAPFSLLRGCGRCLREREISDRRELVQDVPAT